jgi:DNA-binding NtrC family response regulator
MVILVIEDDTEFRDQLCGWLKDKGYETLIAKDEEEAESVLKHSGDSIEIALVDGWLPPRVVTADLRESGLRLIHLMMDKYPTIVAIVYTGHDNPSDVARYMEAGAFSYFVKANNPLQDALLLHQTLRRADEKHRKDRQLRETIASAKRIASAVDELRNETANVAHLLTGMMETIQRIQDEVQDKTHQNPTVNS